MKDAEIKALQAQVNPHFYLMPSIRFLLCAGQIRKNAKTSLAAERLFRSNLQGARQLMIPLSKELNHLEAYLSLEQARFPGKYHIDFISRTALKIWKSLLYLAAAR
ncbi:histidine kinase [Bacillus licheniformis]|nr:histidine kinase [Bacillus licheniformis]